MFPTVRPASLRCHVIIGHETDSFRNGKHHVTEGRNMRRHVTSLPKQMLDCLVPTYKSPCMRNYCEPHWHSDKFLLAVQFDPPSTMRAMTSHSASRTRTMPISLSAVPLFPLSPPRFHLMLTRARLLQRGRRGYTD